MATLTAKQRKALPASSFGLPKSRAYPVPDKAHAAAAKSRAMGQWVKGNLSESSRDKILAKANKVLKGQS